MLKNKLIINYLNIIYLFFLGLPFIHVINYRLSKYHSYGYIFMFIFILMLLILFQKKYKVLIKNSFILWVLFTNIFFIFIYHYFIIKVSLYSMTFFCTPILLCILLSFYSNFYYFIEKYISKIALAYFLIIFFSIAIDFILLNLNFQDYQLMYSSLKKGYINRPFGIFGQPSVNSTLLIVFYSLYLYSIEHKSIGKNSKPILFILLTIGIVLQGSGIGFILYILYVLSVIAKKKHILIVLTIFLFIIISGVIDKISISYILYNIKHIFEALKIFHSYSIFDILFGSGSFGAVDSGFVSPISGVGLIYTVLNLYIYLYLLVKNRNKDLKIAISLLLIGSLHYPAMFYSIAAFFFPFIYFSTILNKHK